MPKSGWDVFRDEKYQEVKNAGFSGRDIFSQLGERWKKVTPKEKKRYGIKAQFLKTVNSDPEILERTSTVHKSTDPKSPCTTRRNSF